MNGFWEKIGFKKPETNTLAGNLGIAALAYLFSILMEVILKVVKGGMSTKILFREREAMSLPLLLITVLIGGVRSRLGEELFFRGVVAGHLLEKMKFGTANILQALIFTLPHALTFMGSPALESGLCLVNAFAQGLALGKMMHRSGGSIVPGIVYCGLVNMIAVPIAWDLL